MRKWIAVVDGRYVVLNVGDEREAKREIRRRYAKKNTSQMVDVLKTMVMVEREDVACSGDVRHWTVGWG